MNSNKLVLFDIDGTMIRPLRPMDALQRFRYGIQKVFGKDMGEITKERWEAGNYNGTVDRHIIWSMIKDLEIPRDHFIDNLGAIGDALIEYLEKISSDIRLYEMIPEAKKLVDLTVNAEHLSEGVLTGNIIQVAQWKLHATGYPSFAFGVFGNEADTRIDLAKLVMPKSQTYFNRQFAPQDIIVIGDTVHDIACARAIGAQVVVVSTGWDVPKEDLKRAKPDLLVDSLMDERLLSLLGLAV